jgi:ribose transport system substrate-binding protein
MMLALVGCNTAATDSETGPGPAGGQSSADSTRGLIGVSVLTLENPFFVTIGETIKQEAAQYGYDTLVVSGNKDVARQSDQVKDFISKGVVAIVLTPCDSMAIGPVIKEANQAGIPVFTADIACQAEEAEIVFHVATDNEGGGREAANAMIEALGEEGGKVAILDFNAVESCQLRVKGFKEVIDEHNRQTSGGKIEIVAELPGGGLREQGYQAAQDAIQSHPDLVGVFAINDPSALGAYAALDAAGKAGQVVIIGFDGQLVGKEAIRDGKIYADPIQFPYRMAVETVNAIMKHLRGEPFEQRTLLIPTELYRQADALKDPELTDAEQ